MVSIVILIWLGVCCIHFWMQNPPLYAIVFPSFFEAVGNMLFRFPDRFFSSIAFELLSLCVHGVFGILFLCLFVRLPWILEGTAGIFIGIGLATFILEFPAIFFWLNAFSVWTILIVLIVLLTFFHFRYGASPAVFECKGEKNQATDPIEKWLYYFAFVCLGGMTAFSFYHALFFPVDYWDSLIYYVHYGEMTFQQGGFPVLYCLQVGLGLGANYPHLFPLHQAVTATMFGQWSDLYGQFLCPLAGLGTIIVVYYVSLHLFRNRLIAILSALIFRSIPFVTSYIVWASDYALIMMYTALFLLFTAWLIQEKTWRSAQPLLCVVAIFPHINYLGWIVWPCLALGLWFARSGLMTNRKGISLIVSSVLIWFGVGLTWYIRNYIVTGNPVYAFFPTIFGGKNINLDVLRSCENEWFRHGNGVAHWGNTVWERIAVSPAKFLNEVWQFAPLFMGIMIPGLLVGWKRKQPFFIISGVLVLLYLFYQYFISGFYLYHIIAIFPILAIFSGRFLASIQLSRLLYAYGAVLILAGIVPGISYSIMGPKTGDPTLPFFAYPGLKTETYYKFRFPKEAPVWLYINREVEEGAKILSHDNRYHVFREDIQIIHLDDCDLVPLYGNPYPEIHEYLLSRGIRYYLYIPDELTHPITQQLGHRKFLENPIFFERLLTSPKDDTPSLSKVQLYRLVGGQTE